MASREDLPTANYSQAVDSTKSGSGETPTVDLSDATQAYESPSSLLAAPTDAIRPREIGNYVIIEEIARGGMGVVYKAHQRGLNRTVALKMTLAGDFAGAEERQRFRLEAEAAGQLDHPCIVPIYEVSQHEGSPYFSMGFVEGQSLRGLLSAGPLPIRRAAEITRMVARAVHYAHTRGIVHRDLKPANILIDSQGLPRVTDFGLAKQVSTNSELTNTGQILGTPSFMPPEQAQGKIDQVGPLADVYSLGATFYSLLTGRPPFQAASLIDTLMQVVHQEPVSPRTLDSSIPRDVETICLKCLEKSPGRRYASADELADDLDRFLNNEPVHARPLGKLQHAWRWCQRKPLAAGLIGAMASLLLVVMVGVWYRMQYAATAQRLASTEAMKRLSDYYAGISRARELTASQQPGVTWQAEKELAQIADFVPDGSEKLLFDSLKADIDSRYDLRLVNTVPTRMRYGAMAFSPDGQRIAVGQRKHGTGFTVSIYKTADLVDSSDAESEETKPPEPLAAYIVSTVSNAFSQLLSGTGRYQDGARSLAWSPDGTWLVVGSRFGQLTRWNTLQPQLPGTTWSGGDRPVNTLFFSADGQNLFSLSNQWKQWDCANNWTEIRQTAESIGTAILAPNASMLLAHMNQLDVVALVDVKTRQRVHTWRDGLTMRPEAFSPDGRTVAGVEDNAVAIRLTADGQLCQTIKLDDSESAIDADSLRFLNGQVIAGKDSSRRLHFWDVATGRPIFQPISSADDAMQWSYDPQAGLLVMTDTQSRDLLRIYQLRTPKVVQSFPQLGMPRSVGFSADSQELAIVSNSLGGDNFSAWTELNLRSLDQPESTKSLRVEHPARPKPMAPFTLAYHPVARRIAWFAGTEGLMDSEANQDSFSHQFVPSVAFQSALPKAFVQHDRLITGVDELLRLDANREPTGDLAKPCLAAWSPDGRRLWGWIDEQKQIVVWNADNLKMVGSWSNKHKEITTGLAGIACLVVGQEFAICGGENGTISVLPTNLPNDPSVMIEPIDEFLGPGGCVKAIALGPHSPDKQAAWILIGTQTGKVQIRALPSGQVLTEVSSDQGGIQSVAVGSSGKLIATGGEDGIVRLMHLDSQLRVTPWLTMPSHCSAIEQLRISPDEKYLAVVGRQAKHVFVWNLSMLKNQP